MKKLPWIIGGGAAAMYATGQSGRRAPQGLVWTTAPEDEGEEAVIPGGIVWWSNYGLPSRGRPDTYVGGMQDRSGDSFLVVDPATGSRLDRFIFYPASLYDHVVKAYFRGVSPPPPDQHNFKSAAAAKDAAEAAWDRLMRFKQAGRRRSR